MKCMVGEIEDYRKPTTLGKNCSKEELSEERINSKNKKFEFKATLVEE